jgi:uncharacterized surface protein with fasciclin (FAS1) repeats
MLKILALSVAAVYAQTNTLLQVVLGRPELKDLVAAATQANITDAMMYEGPFTIFAPETRAFAALGQELLTFLLNPHNQPTLLTILEYHFHAGSVLSTDLKNGEVISTLDGFQTVTATLKGADAFINNARVVTPNLVASNGVVHTVDAVLVPSNIVLPSKRIVELAKTVPQLSTLVTAIGAGIVVAPLLDDIGPLTVLAPSNDAFNALPAGELDYLLKHPLDLDAVLLYHVTDVGRVYSEELENGEHVRMLDTNDVTATVGSDGSITFNANSTVIVANVDATNGVVHVIDNVLIPPAVRAKMDVWKRNHGSFRK